MARVQSMLLAGFALLAHAVPEAMAHGTLACVVEDRSLSLALNATAAAAKGYGLTEVTGSLAVKLDGTPRDAGRLDLNRQSVAQYWFQDRNLKLFIVEEKADGPRSETASVWLDLKQVRTDVTTYRGSYRLQSRHRDAKTTGAGIVQEASGYAECSAD